MLNFLQERGIGIFGRVWSSVCTLLSTLGSQLAGRTCPGGSAAVPGLGGFWISAGFPVWSAEHFGTARCALGGCEQTGPEAMVIEGRVWGQPPKAESQHKLIVAAGVPSITPVGEPSSAWESPDVPRGAGLQLQLGMQPMPRSTCTGGMGTEEWGAALPPSRTGRALPCCSSCGSGSSFFLESRVSEEFRLSAGVTDLSTDGRENLLRSLDHCTKGAAKQAGATLLEV